MARTNDFSALEALNTKDINLNDYTFAQERFDERFGLVFYMKSKGSTKALLVKERSKDLTPEQFQETSARLRIANDHLLKIHGVKQVPNASTFQIYFEDFSTDLYSEIKRHLKEKTRFSEGELYAIIYCATNALAALEQNRLSHDFLVPMNILKLSKDSYKLHDNYTLAPKNNLYTHALRGQYQKYLAPELLESLTTKKEKPDAHDAQKADIFALGMCLLEAGLLELEGDYINRKLMILNEKAITQALNRFGETYSGAMRQILEDMLSPDPSKRPSASVLQRRLPGKPRLPGQPSSAKKRKVLDQLMNSPESKIGGSRIDPLSLSKSPSRYDDSFGSSLYASTNNPQRMLLIEKSPSFEPNRYSSPPQHDVLYQSHTQSFYPETRDFDASSSYISPAIKNDPILAKFINRIASPPKYNFASQLQTSTAPKAYQSNVQTFVSPSKLTTSYATYQPERRETEVRSSYHADPLVATQKVSYPVTTSSYIPHDLYADTYRTNLSYVSVPQTQVITKPKEDDSTYRSSYSEYHTANPQTSIRATYEVPKSSYQVTSASYSTLPKPYAEVSKVDTKTYQTTSYSSLPRAYPEVSAGTSNIDDMINKALSRSSTNLRSSQHGEYQQSPGLTPILKAEETRTQTQTQAQAFKPNLTSSSFGYSTMSPLDPIYERQSSEDFTTPINSKILGTTPKGDNISASFPGKESNLTDKINKA